MFFSIKVPLLSAIVFLFAPFIATETPSAGLLSLVKMVPFMLPEFWAKAVFIESSSRQARKINCGIRCFK
jgi:hypothetical protein